MQIPVRLAALGHRSLAPAVLLAVAYSTVVLVGTPFVVPEVVDRYDVGLGAASLVSVLQLGGFVVGSYGAGRFLEPGRVVLRNALLLTLVAQLIAAVEPPFLLLLGTRLLSGLGLGLIAWFGWSQAFGDDSRTADLAVVGPIVGIVAAPLLSFAGSTGGLRGIYLVMAAVALVPLPWVGGVADATATRTASERRTKAVPAAKVILGSLFAFTLGGAAVFQFVVVLGTSELGLSSTALALAFSANAVVGVPAARWPAERRGVPGPWMMGTGVMAVIVATATTEWLFLAAVVAWGFMFWMAIPGAYAVLAARSAYPAQRAGDAQALMALGRVIGPLVGGLVLDGSGTTLLAAVGGGTMVASGVAMFLTRVMAPPRAA